MAEAVSRPKGVLYHRHSGVVRITHWVNVLCMLVLLMTGLQIFNAHPALYWGNISTFDDPVFAARPERQPDGTIRGVTEIFDAKFDTTGTLGLSEVANGRLAARGFPSWATLPSYQDLAGGRRWHFFFAWAFVINGLIYLLYTAVTGHWRQLVPTGAQFRGIGRDIRDHVRLRFHKGEEAKVYNVLQKITYFLVIFVILPVLILAGLMMSPGLNAKFPWLLELFGGRQSARTIHFVTAALMLAFVFLHVALVLVSGVWNNMRSMVTGKYRIEEDARHAAE
jgi:thiosulfate reductase cytochrome b subunit